MKSLCLISQHFYPSKASTAQLMTDLAIGLNKSGYRVSVFTSTPASQHEACLSSALDIYRSNTFFQEKKSILSKIIASLSFLFGGLYFIIFRMSPSTQLLIASNPPYAGILGVLFKVIRGGSYIFLLQDIFPDSAFLSGIMQKPGLLYRIMDKLIFLICKKSRNTIVLTSAMQTHLLNKYPKLKDMDKVEVIENWSIESIVPQEKANNPFACNEGLVNVFTVLYSGNMGRLHDIETILEAAQLLTEEPIQFLFIGDGPKKGLVEDYIARNKGSNVRLLPFQSREQLHLSLTACDVTLVSLIEGAETIVAPCKLYGMLASGRAIVAISTENSYIENMVVEYECGVNCPPGDANKLANTLKLLANQPQKVALLSSNAHKLYLEHYQVNRAISEYEKLLFT